jgi:hypothetical protein
VRHLAFKHLAYRHLDNRHLDNRHLDNRHLADRYLADRHLADRHLVDRYLADRHLANIYFDNEHSAGLSIIFVLSKPARSVRPCLLINSPAVGNSLFDHRPNVCQSNVFDPKAWNPFGNIAKVHYCQSSFELC